MPSQGLQIVGHLARWFIKPDIQYLKYIERLGESSDQKLDTPTLDKLRDSVDKLAGSAKFATDVIEPPFRCLSGWSRRVADDTADIDGHVSEFAGIFRYLHDLENDSHRDTFSTQFMQRSTSLADDVKTFSGLFPSKDASSQNPKSKSCTSNDTTSKEPPCTCLSDFISKSSNNSNGHPNDYVETALDKIAANNEFKERPYLAIAHASVMAQLGQYRAATAILEDWLDPPAFRSKTTGNQPGAGSGIAEKWFELRARSVLATYTEEWMKRDEANVTTTLRDEHLENLENLLTLLRAALDKEPFFSAVLEPPAQERIFAVLEAKARGRSINFIVPDPDDCRFQDNEKVNHKEEVNQDKEEIKPDDNVPKPFFWRYLFTLYVTEALTL